MGFPVGEIVEVKIGYTINAQQCYNVLHYVSEDAVPGITPYDQSLELLNQLDNQLPVAGTLLNMMRLMMGTNVQINELSVQGIYPTRYRAAKGTYASPGLGDGTCHAQNVAAYIEKFGMEAGRSKVGSFHLGGLFEGEYETGDLTAGGFANLQTLAEQIKEPIAFVADGVDQDYTPCILNKTKVIIDGKTRYVISGFTEIFNCAAYRTLRTQRTRTKGYGI